MIYKIGSFNMRNFGYGSRKDFDLLAKIIIEEQFDVIALQEILSEGKGVRRLLEEFVRYDLYEWDFCWEAPSSPSDITKMDEIINNDRRGEGYAYIWNKKKFGLVEYEKLHEDRVFVPRIINSKSNDVSKDISFFVRAPYYIRLQPKYGGFFEIRLINVHIYYGDKTLEKVNDRKVEYSCLIENIYPEISKKRYGDFRTAYTIAMGDYNLNVFSPYNNYTDRNSEILGVYTDDQNFHVYTIQEQLSTLKANKSYDNFSSNLNETDLYANNYDHFSYSPQLSGFRFLSCGVVDVINKYCNGDYTYYRENVSDHVPIFMNIEI